MFHFMAFLTTIYYEHYTNTIHTTRSLCRMFAFSPEVPQLATGLSLLQQMESVYPAFLVQGEVEEEEGLGLTALGTLLSPNRPAEKHREHLDLSLRQQME